MEINIKKEIPSLDRKNFQQVCGFVGRIVNDIMETHYDDDSLRGLMSDYMIDLINPELLDFDSTND